VPPAVTKCHSTKAADALTVTACFQAVHICTSQFDLRVLQRTLVNFRLGWIKLNHDMISDLDLDLHQNGRYIGGEFLMVVEELYVMGEGSW
jgi:hypothetical protein